MTGQDNDGSVPNQVERIQRTQGMPTTSNNIDADEIFRGHDGVDDTTSFDNMPPMEHYEGPRVVILPVPRELNVYDQWRFIFREYCRTRTFLVPKDYNNKEAKRRLGKKK